MMRMRQRGRGENGACAAGDWADKTAACGIDLVMGAVILAISVLLVPWWQSGVLTLGMMYWPGYITSFQRIERGNILCDLVAGG